MTPMKALIYAANFNLHPLNRPHIEQSDPGALTCMVFDHMVHPMDLKNLSRSCTQEKIFPNFFYKFKKQDETKTREMGGGFVLFFVPKIRYS